MCDSGDIAARRTQCLKRGSHAFALINRSRQHFPGNNNTVSAYGREIGVGAADINADRPRQLSLRFVFRRVTCQSTAATATWPGNNMAIIGRLS